MEKLYAKFYMFKELFKGFFHGSIFKDIIDEGRNSFTFASYGRELTKSLNITDL